MSREAGPDIHAETSALVEALRENLIKGGLLNWTVGSYLQNISEAAAGQVTFEPAIQATTKALDAIESLQTAVAHLKKRLEELEFREVYFSPTWWDHQCSAVEGELEEQPRKALALFVRLLSESLASWDFRVREALLERPLVAKLSAPQPRLAELARTALKTLAENEKPADASTEEFLSLLLEIGREDGSPARLDPHTTAKMLVLRGRIRLYDCRATDGALDDFKEARLLDPNSLLVKAALGEHMLATENIAEAERLFKEALQEGLLGMGLLAEREARWGAAAERYEKAVDRIIEEPNPVQALGRLRAPASVRAYYKLAERLQDKDQGAALNAARCALNSSRKPAYNASTDECRYWRRFPHQLAAQMLERLGQNKEAAEESFQAGKDFYYSREYDASTEAFAKSQALDPERRDAAWELTDSCLVASSTKQGEEKTALFKRGMATYDVEAAKGAPEAQYSWALGARGALAEQMGVITPAENWSERLEWYGQALAYAEQAVLADESGVRNWARLIRFLRLLGLEENESAVVEQSAKLGNADTVLREERIISLANIGRVYEAEELLKDDFDPAKSAWAKLVQAFLRCEEGKYAEVVRILSTEVTEKDLALWGLAARAVARDFEGDRDGATSDWQKLEEMASEPENAETKAYAAWMNGKPGKALELMVPLTSNPLRRGGAMRNIAIAHLMLGEYEKAQEAVTESLRWSNRSDVSRWLRQDLSSPRLEKVPSKELEKVLKQVTDHLESPPKAPDEEITSAQKGFGVQPGEESWIAAGLDAAKARSLLDLHRPDEAISLYRSLLAMKPIRGDGPPPFPYAAEGLVKAAAEKAEAGYESFVRGETSAARNHIREALRLAAGKGPGVRVGQTLFGQLKDPAHYFALSDFLAELPQMIEPDLFEPLDEVKEKVGTFLEEHFHLRTAEQTPLLRPISVELSPDLIPEDTSSEGWSLIATCIPELRERIRLETGIKIPSVNLREGPVGIEESSIVLFVNEIKTAKSHVPGEGLDLKRFQTVAEKMEALLRPQLAEFVDLQTVQTMLDSWSEDPKVKEKADKVARDPLSRIKLTSVLRELTKEHVPLTRPLDILSALEDAPLKADLGRCVRAIRLALRDQLPGSGSESHKITIPPDLSEEMGVWMWAARAGVFLAAPADEVAEWLSRISDLLPPDLPSEDDPHGWPVLVTESDELRAPLRRIICSTLPHVFTISRAELAQVTQATTAEKEGVK